MSPAGSHQSIAVIGGGVSGVACALALAKTEKFEITLYEKELQLGGLNSWYQWQDVICDRYYHVILPADDLMIEFLGQLGLESQLFWKESKSGFFGNGKLVSFSSAMDFIRFPFLSFWQKIRLGMGILYSSRIRDPRKLSLSFAPQWLSRVFGPKVFENFWEPLVRSKLGQAADRTSAAFLWATIRRLYKARSRTQHKEKMGYIHGGTYALQRAAEKKLSEFGVEVCTGTSVERLSHIKSEIVIKTAAGQRSFDEALFTVPNPVISDIIPDTEHLGSWRNLLQTEYLGVICVLLILRRSLSPYYVINLLDKDLPFTGIIESTNVIPPKNFSDRHLVYLPKYVMLNDPLYNTSDDKIIKGFIEYLKKIFFDLRDENILHCHVFRERFVQPIHNPQSLAQLSNYRTPLPKVYLANSSLIKDSTLNNNAVQHIALDAIQTIVADRRMD